MTYEQALNIVEWTSEMDQDHVTRYMPDQILQALAIVALGRPGNLREILRDIYGVGDIGREDKCT